jgi:hypothetical protein
MSSSGTLHHVALVRTDVLEECIASIIRVTRISGIHPNRILLTEQGYFAYGEDTLLRRPESRF